MPRLGALRGAWMVRSYSAIFTSVCARVEAACCCISRVFRICFCTSAAGHRRARGPAVAAKRAGHRIAKRRCQNRQRSRCCIVYNDNNRKERALNTFVQKDIWKSKK